MTPDIPEDEDELMDGPAPAATIAGPQTPQNLVAQRIAQVRSSGGQPDDEDDDDDPDPKRAAAMQFAQKEALTSGIGRALNSLAAGTGAKVDNSTYDQMDKQPKIATDVATDEMDRSAEVQKAIEDRKAKADALKSTLSLKEQIAQLAQKNKDSQTNAYDRRTNAMGSVAGNKIDNANIRAGNTIMNDKNAQTEVKKLQASRSAQSLVDGIRNGDITDSKNISKQLTNMISTIELGTPGGQGDRQSMGVDTLYGKLKGALGYVEGKPEGVIPKDYLNQLESEVHALGDRAAANYKNITDGALNGADLSGGNPDADTGKVYTLAKQRRDSLMKSNGYDPDTGKSLAPRTGSSASAPHGGKYPPGTVVNVKGKKYTVGPDGDSLQEQTQEASL